MKKWSHYLRKQTTRLLDLPEDVTMEMPRVTMIGSIHIYIENHRGVLRFTDSELRLLLTNGQLRVQGEAFVLRMILPEEVLLEGRIEQVRYLDEE